MSLFCSHIGCQFGWVYNSGLKILFPENFGKITPVFPACVAGEKIQVNVILDSL